MFGHLKINRAIATRYDQRTPRVTESHLSTRPTALWLGSAGMTSPHSFSAGYSGFVVRFGRDDLYWASWQQARVAIDNDLFVGIQAEFNDCRATNRLTHAYWSDSDSAVRLNHPNEIAPRAVSDGGGRDGQAIATVFDDDLAIDKIARPELVLFVIEVGLELDCPGSLIDGVVDRLNLSTTERDNAVLGVSYDRQIGQPK